MTCKCHSRGCLREWPRLQFANSILHQSTSQSSRWANAGVADRRMDFQVWCGPAMGAFNEWTKGSFLEMAKNRRVVAVVLNLLHGAALTQRFHALRCQGVELPEEWTQARPENHVGWVEEP